jgi:uncharacterized membrane protein HdeD (DUF308 family)
MSPSDPQFLYMILVLPSLFGIALIGEGINKIVHEEWAGLISITFGLVFISIVIFAFLFFSSYFGRQI